MVFMPVGIRCPDHAGSKRPVARVGSSKSGHGVSFRKPGTPLEGTEALVTKALIAINVGIYVIGVVQGAGWNAPGGSLYLHTILYGPLVAVGDWWRLITAAFLHASVIHIAFNMLALWWFGAPVEAYLGRLRFVLVYLVSGLAGSAGALLATPNTPVLGASGAIFGILGAMLILEYQATGSLGGNAMTLIVINLGLSFVISNVSWGGHVGGLVGGIAAMLAITRLGRKHPTYSPLGLVGAGSILAVGVISVVVAEWAARSLT
jgi:membrane associated rhomboid family serine protease